MRPEGAFTVTNEEFQDLTNKFSYHRPFGDQADRYENIRRAGLNFALQVMGNCPRSAERTLAIRDIEAAVMRANQSIAINEKEEESI